MKTCNFCGAWHTSNQQLQQRRSRTTRGRSSSIPTPKSLTLPLGVFWCSSKVQQVRSDTGQEQVREGGDPIGSGIHDEVHLSAAAAEDGGVEETWNPYAWGEEYDGGGVRGEEEYKWTSQEYYNNDAWNVCQEEEEEVGVGLLYPMYDPIYVAPKTTTGGFHRQVGIIGHPIQLLIHVQEYIPLHLLSSQSSVYL